METTSRSARLFLAACVVIHAAFLASLVLGKLVDHPQYGRNVPTSDPSAFHRYGFLNDLFHDASPHMYGQGPDFFIVLSAGRYFREGRNIYDLRPHRSVPYAYIPYPYLPPIANLASLIWQETPAWRAYWSWVAFYEALLLGNLWLAHRMLRSRAAGSFPILAGMWLAYFPLYVELYMGQMNFLMTTFVHVFLVAALARRPILLALVLAGGCVAKMLPVLFVPPLLRFRRFAVLAAAAAFVALPLLPHALDFTRMATMRAPWPLPALGVEDLVLPAGLHQILSHLTSSAVPGNYAGSPSFGGLLRCLIPSARIQTVIRLTFLVAAIVLPILRPRTLATACGVVLASYFLAYSHPWEHHYVIALPLFSLLAYLGRPWLSRSILPWLLLAAPTPFVLYGTKVIESPLYYAPKAAGSLLLFGIAAWAAWSDEGRE